MTQPKYISELQIRKQAPKFYFTAIAWPIYIFLIPFVFAKSKPLSIIFMLFPGVYLYTWMACLMHECWHKYVPNIPNNAFYNLFSYMLLTDPQIYRLLHGGHHAKVNTWDDTEFHPLGRISNTLSRRLYNFLEIVIGVIFIFGLHMHIITTHEKYKTKYKRNSNILSITLWIVIYGTLGLLSALTFNLNTSQIIAPILISFWLGAFFIHHAQMIEHANLIIEGDVHQRNVKLRNLKYETLPQKFFHFLTHSDTREHVIHHTNVAIYSRPFPKILPIPEDAVFISLADYAKILWNMLAKG